MSNVGIVGGGLLGMTLAKRLTSQGHRVTVLEAASQSGGLAAPARLGEYTWDRFYHVVLLSDAYLRALIEELGLTGQLHWKPTRTGFYIDGRLRSLSSTLEFLTFPALGLLDKARLGATILYASRLRDWRPLESISPQEAPGGARARKERLASAMMTVARPMVKMTMMGAVTLGRI